MGDWSAQRHKHNHCEDIVAAGSVLLRQRFRTCDIHTCQEINVNVPIERECTDLDVTSRATRILAVMVLGYICRYSVNLS